MTLASTIVYIRQQMLWVFSPLIVFEYSSVLDICLTMVTEYLTEAAHRRELTLPGQVAHCGRGDAAEAGAGGA